MYQVSIDPGVLTHILTNALQNTFTGLQKTMESGFHDLGGNLFTRAHGKDGDPNSSVESVN